MGQRLSVTEDLGGVILSKNGTDIENVESNAFKDVEKNSADGASSAAEQSRQLESGDPPMPAQKDDVEAGNSGGISPPDPTAFAALNPGIAEFSHLTALRMMRNFEGLSRIDDLFLSHVNEIHERMLDDNLSEKDFRTISYESLPISEFHDPTEVLKRDNSTYTHDLMEAEVNDYRECTVNSCPALTTADNISCKEEAAAAHEPPAESKQQRGDGPEEPDREERRAESEGRCVAKTSDAELRRLREALERLECERDVARMRLLIAEDKCKSYEEESRCLEATLGSMETKLRSMASELREEVKHSQQLQHKLAEAIRSAGDSAAEPPMEAAA